MTRIVAGTTLIFMSCTAFGQPTTALSGFESASIRTTKPGTARGVRAEANKGLTITNLNLKQLMLYAYELQNYQLSGPDWIEAEEGYDVTAQVKGSASAAQIQRMLQALLEEHFKLKLHRETREISAYLLVVAKGGAKLPDEKEMATFNASLHGASPFKPGMMAIIKTGDVPAFVERLSRGINAPIVDKTGIKGQFFYHLEWSDDPPPHVSPGLLTALQEQLGLSLEQGKATVEVLVIDSAQKPLEN